MPVLAAHIFPEMLRGVALIFFPAFFPLFAPSSCNRKFFHAHMHAWSRVKFAKKIRALLKSYTKPNASPERDCYKRERARAHASVCVWHVGKEFPRGSIVIAGALSRLKTSLQEQRKSEALLQLSPSSTPHSFTRRLFLGVSRKRLLLRDSLSLPPFLPLVAPSRSENLIFPWSTRVAFLIRACTITS